MTTTHTPGPWTLGNEPDPLVYGPTGPYIAQVLAYGRDDRGAGTLRSNYAADAWLITAAPELLISLQRMLDVCYDVERDDATVTAVAAARSAISRATTGRA